MAGLPANCYTLLYFFYRISRGPITHATDYASAFIFFTVSICLAGHQQDHLHLKALLHLLIMSEINDDRERSIVNDTHICYCIVTSTWFLSLFHFFILICFRRCCGMPNVCCPAIEHALCATSHCCSVQYTVLIMLHKYLHVTVSHCSFDSSIPLLHIQWFLCATAIIVLSLFVLMAGWNSVIN